ncbi:hypothetical protein A0J61_05750 [Choanephora cucurbitarum]|uniref:Uncharacterized protein n=1 Tax=Choanephora cucurbitarum TaxID=101091 RepID=A0A1C7NAR5_9FUNG|nr:hypothetical protein A0J61_05750 [Choanephora cucurbitarum]
MSVPNNLQIPNSVFPRTPRIIIGPANFKVPEMKEYLDECKYFEPKRTSRRNSADTVVARFNNIWFKKLHSYAKHTLNLKITSSAKMSFDSRACPI